MSYGVDVTGLKEQIQDEMFSLGHQGVKLLAFALTRHAKRIVPLLSNYGVQNRERIPHHLKAYKGEIQHSIKTIKSPNIMDSWLVNITDWRAHFMSGGTAKHEIKGKYRVVGSNKRSALAFLGSKGKKKGQIVFKDKVHHPGMKGARVLEQLSQDDVVNNCVEEVRRKIYK